MRNVVSLLARPRGWGAMATVTSLAAGCAATTSGPSGFDEWHLDASTSTSGLPAEAGDRSYASDAGAGIRVGSDGPATAVTDGAVPDGACAATLTKTTVNPVDLVFMFDKSGSMDDSVGGGLTRWTAVTPGLVQFFADPKSAGLSASLQFFMQPDECNVNAYASPLVPMSPLPDKTGAFSSAIAATSPKGETPTLPAVQGALQYASTLQQQQPGAHVAVVLVTDGEPNGCSSTIPAVASAVQAYATQTPAIQTFVVGVGKSLVNLDAIADAGGTGSAFLVATANNPDAGGTSSQTESDFLSALNQIRGAALSCNLKLPDAPQGQKLDLTKVNVVYASGGSGTGATLPYNPGCGVDGGATDGWRYDAPTPSAIVLCPQSCNTIQADVTAEIQLALGCATQTVVPR